MKTRAVFLVVIATTMGVVGCGNSIVSGGSAGSGGLAGSGGSGGSGNAGGSVGVGGWGGEGSVLGTKLDCSAPSGGLGLCDFFKQFGDTCTSQGGFYDYCNNVKCSYLPQCDTLCHPPPPPPSQDEFGCTWLNCAKGQICVHDEPLGDGCSYHRCMTPPAPCTANPTCACLETMLGCPTTCEEDANGNVMLKGLAVSSCLGG